MSINFQISVFFYVGTNGLNICLTCLETSSFRHRFHHVSMFFNVLDFLNAPKRDLTCANDSFHREDFGSFRGFSVRPFCVELRPFHSANRKLAQILYINFMISRHKDLRINFVFMFLTCTLMRNRVKIYKIIQNIRFDVCKAYYNEDTRQQRKSKVDVGNKYGMAV